jgi:hypothetical protein
MQDNNRPAMTGTERSVRDPSEAGRVKAAVSARRIPPPEPEDNLAACPRYRARSD